MQRIGTESEKTSVEKELAELRERLAKVEQWKQKKAEIESELNKVWVESEQPGEDTVELPPPSYLESTTELSLDEAQQVESASASDVDDKSLHEEKNDEELAELGVESQLDESHLSASAAEISPASVVESELGADGGEKTQ